MSKHVFQVGDLVTCERMRDPIRPHDLLVCRIGLMDERECVLLPLQASVEQIRAFPAADLTLVEAWTGPELLRCNADLSEMAKR